MEKLPLIVSFGGINPAGRGSNFNAYRRLVFDKLEAARQRQTLHNLAALTGRIRYDKGGWVNAVGEAVELEACLRELQSDLLADTLIRKLEIQHFNGDCVPYHCKAKLSAGEQPLQFTLSRKQLPVPVPDNWHLSEGPNNATVRITTDSLLAMLPTSRQADVKAAGQLPTGFDPGTTYSSRNHPRALQMTVFGASDAIQYMGICWDSLKQRVAPDQISVYAGSCLGQLDYKGYGGLLQARLLGRKVTSKQLPLGLNEMPADFLNAYLLGSLGTTGHNNGACATFLYNLRQGMRDIQSGSHRLSIIGTSESSLTSEVYEAFVNMGALASDESLRQLDGLTSDSEPDYRRACRPFARNSGFTVAESAQFIVLMDDQLALETGASIYGAVNEVFVNADGHKKSITGPGLGNYLTMAKALAATRNIIGETGVKHATMVQAHGTGTPQNRVSESAILNEVAASFGIKQWPVTAIKSYLGHSVASASGDQLLTSLGIWKDGIIPGILTIDALAEDVVHDHLDFLLQHREIDPARLDAVLINSKGFGGNNASASILAPHLAGQMLEKRHGKQAMVEYHKRNIAVQESAGDYIASTERGENRTIYKFDHQVLDGTALKMDENSVKINGLSRPVNLQLPNRYADMCD
ncbi:MAG: beta-ketoacyl synthase [Gammaproteobacteria bacterium]|nr:beta-ketoacyl synthase [Gammaproteobacteria bacterium]MCY4358128.1 beta-ketoacyl synthase [Gammaproteobacteria bacterium]